VFLWCSGEPGAGVDQHAGEGPTGCNIFPPPSLAEGQNIAAACGTFGDRQAFVYGLDLWLGEAKLGRTAPSTPLPRAAPRETGPTAGTYTQVGTPTRVPQTPLGLPRAVQSRGIKQLSV